MIYTPGDKPAKTNNLTLIKLSPLWSDRPSLILDAPALPADVWVLKGAFKAKKQTHVFFISKASSSDHACMVHYHGSLCLKPCKWMGSPLFLSSAVLKPNPTVIRCMSTFVVTLVGRRDKFDGTQDPVSLQMAYFRSMVKLDWLPHWAGPLATVSLLYLRFGDFKG